MHQSPDSLHHSHHHPMMAAPLGLNSAHHLPHHLQHDPFHSPHLSEYPHHRSSDPSDALPYSYEAHPDLSMHQARSAQYTPSPSDESQCESPSLHSRGELLESSVMGSTPYLPSGYHLPLQVSFQKHRSKQDTKPCSVILLFFSMFCQPNLCESNFKCKN